MDGFASEDQEIVGMFNREYNLLSNFMALKLFPNVY